MDKRFVVIVLDGFGMGAMKDAATARSGDELIYFWQYIKGLS